MAAEAAAYSYTFDRLFHANCILLDPQIFRDRHPQEMLKELMHSMGMSLVREKAVGAFMERLDRRVQVSERSDGRRPVQWGPSWSAWAGGCM